MTERKIAIFKRQLPKNQRVFDVTVDNHGEIQKFEIKNVRGYYCIDMSDVKGQITKALTNSF